MTNPASRKCNNNAGNYSYFVSYGKQITIIKTLQIRDKKNAYVSFNCRVEQVIRFGKGV